MKKILFGILLAGMLGEARSTAVAPTNTMWGNNSSDLARRRAGLATRVRGEPPPYNAEEHGPGAQEFKNTVDEVLHGKIKMDTLQTPLQSAEEKLKAMPIEKSEVDTKYDERQKEILMLEEEFLALEKEFQKKKNLVKDEMINDQTELRQAFVDMTAIGSPLSKWHSVASKVFDETNDPELKKEAEIWKQRYAEKLSDINKEITKIDALILKIRAL